MAGVSVKRFIILCTAILASPFLYAQESLDTILDRGYVAHWLVCGPFTPDAEGGIVAAVRRGDAPLGDTDFMAPAGGIARMRPKHLMKVQTPAGTAVWQEAGSKDETLDLSPFFPNTREGVAYAAFYAVSQGERLVYLDIQSPLGVRAYLNGFPLREIHAAPAAAAGVDRLGTMFRAGTNLLVLEIPGASLEALAEATGVDMSHFKTQGFLNRPMLQETSGFEFGLRILPLERMSKTAYVPKLESTGTFAGRGADLRQRVRLTVFNPYTEVSPAVKVQATASGMGAPVEVTLGPITPETQAEALMPIPIAGRAPGDALRVDVTIEAGSEQAAFASSITVGTPPPSGRVYVVPVEHLFAAADGPASTADRLAILDRQVALLGQDPSYGFSLGGLDLWKPYLECHPEARAELLDAVSGARCAAHAGYTVPDERLASGELLVRNLAYGHHTAWAVLRNMNPCYLAWDTPAIAPQTPQLLTQAGLKGIVSNLQILGIPELSRHQALDGTALLHRRKQSAPGPTAAFKLHEMALLQRRELLERGLDSDILINESVLPSPEPFLVGACKTLADGIPALLITGAGGQRFLEDIRPRVDVEAVPVPTAARLTNSYQLGALLAQTDLKQAHSAVENLVLTAEKLATLAGLLGATYPEAALDMAWRQLLHNSTASTLGFCGHPRSYLDALAAYREAAALAAEVRDKSLAYMAREADVYAAAPDRTEGVLALVVFNPSSWPRTDVCHLDIDIPPSGGLAIFDDAGQDTPFLANELRVSRNRLVGARVRLVATDVPALGYKTYYLRPRGALPKPSQGPGAQIENEYFRVLIDGKTGAITSLIDKATDIDHAQGPLNEIVALREDASKSHGGRDLWTSGEIVRAGANKPEVTVSRSGLCEQAVITSPFRGGKLTRRVTLYRGVPRVDCEARFEGVDAGGHCFAATFKVNADNRAPIFGERFGAVVGRKGTQALDWQTEDGVNTSGTGMQPALRWAALSPNDHIEAGPDTAAPLGPCAVVHGDNPALRRAAEEIQAALASRGIPSATWTDRPRRLSTIWTDSTEFPNLNDDLNYGTAMRVVVGSPEQNIVSKHLFLQLTERTILRLRERMTEGAVLFFEDIDVPDGQPPVPTLLLAGHTDTTTVSLAEGFAQAVRATGVYAMPPEAFLPVERQVQPDSGLAVLFPGTALAGTGHDGTLVLGLWHDAQWTTPEGDNMGIHSAGGTHTFHYALLPFAHTWREARVPQAAHAYNEAFVGAVTDLHLGPLPAQQGFLEPQNADFILTALKPSGFNLASMLDQTPAPRDGITVRGYEATGRPWGGNLRLFTSVRDAWESNPLESRGDPLPFDKNLIVLRVPAFDVKTVGIAPSSRAPRGQSAELSPSIDPNGPIFTRYWRHGSGAAPLGFQPVSMLLRGDLEDDSPAITALIANNLTGLPLQGTVHLYASEGWTISPTTFDYDLAPGEFAEQEVLVLRRRGLDETGGVVTWTTYGGRRYQDLLALDDAPLAIEISRNDTEFRVTAINRSGLAAEGYVELIIPPECWPELGGRKASVTPRRAPVHMSRPSEASAYYSAAPIPKRPPG